MINWTHKLFSEGELADFLIDRWQLFLTDMRDARPDSGPVCKSPPDNLAQLAVAPMEEQEASHGESLQVSAMLTRYRLDCPVLLSGFKIVEHGWVEELPETPRPLKPEDFNDRGDYLDAKIAELTDRLHKMTHRRSWIIVEIAIEGQADLLRYWPPGCLLPAPQGQVCAHSLRLRFERAGSDDDAWEQEARSNLAAIDGLLEETSKLVDSFNHQLLTTCQQSEPKVAFR